MERGVGDVLESESRDLVRLEGSRQQIRACRRRKDRQRQRQRQGQRQRNRGREGNKGAAGVEPHGAHARQAAEARAQDGHTGSWVRLGLGAEIRRRGRPVR